MPAIVHEKPGWVGQRRIAIAAHRAVYWLARHWIVAFAALASLYAGLPWLAPILMEAGWVAGARGIYAVYSTQCHQLPQRSYFLFGSQTMYTLEQIQAVAGPTENPLVLRQFVGSADMGWKVAWSDRMVAMYTGVLAFGLLYWPLRRRIRPLPWWGFALLALPLAVDGATHFVSDFAGLGQGFRDTNAWLATLTGEALPLSFYVGDGLGSVNSWLRLSTGALFALGIIWLGLPYLNGTLEETAARIEGKLNRAGWRV